MLKTQAIELLGGTVTAASEAIGISPAAVSQWPEELSDSIRDRVQAALWRKNIVSGLDRAKSNLEISPDDRLSKLIAKNRTQAIQELSKAKTVTD